MRKYFKSRFPAFNIPRRNEAVATDTIFSDTHTIDSGVTMAQIFVGKESLVSDVYPMQFSKQFVNTLEDTIRFIRAVPIDPVTNDQPPTTTWPRPRDRPHGQNDCGGWADWLGHWLPRANKSLPIFLTFYLK